MARRLPAEWEAHRTTIVAWPGRPSVWGDHLAQGREETAVLVRALAESEPVVVAFAPSSQMTAREALGGVANVSLVEVALDDSWARDISPLFVLDDRDRSVEAVDFRFNAWGGKFSPFDSDAAFGEAIAAELGIRRRRSDLCCEGGSIATDGLGTAIIVESTLLNPNRNPGLDRSTVEEELERTLGVRHVIWLPCGLTGDTDTDGHVDNVAVFSGPGQVLVQAAPGGDHPDAERLRRNRRVLETSRDSRGGQMTLVEVPWLPVSNLDESRPCPYLNFCFSGRSVIIPVVDDVTDEVALDLLSEVFHSRDVRPTPSNALSYGGGGPHCMTMQVTAIQSEVSPSWEQT